MSKKNILSVIVCLFVCMQAHSQALFQHPWQGKRVAYLGDSTTDPNNKGAKKKYWSWLQDWLQITPYVYGVSGRQWDDIPRQANKLKDEHGNDFDAILIFMGTNDYNRGIPLGEWWDERETMVEYGHGGQAKQMVARRQRTPAKTNETYRGRINIALDSLKRMFPDKQIVLLTPIHRSDFHANDKNWQCDESYTNRCGLYIDEYINAVKEAANIWAVPVIDWNASCGLFPLIAAHGQYFKDSKTDLLHPNDKGQQRMARTLMYQLLTLPCVFNTAE